MDKLTHLDAAGQVSMVDVSGKPASVREARAEGWVRMDARTLDLALAGDAKKGNVTATAEIAGIMAAKRAADLIPLCHPIALSSIKVAISPDRSASAFRVEARARTTGQTGVEMEALTAVSVACLTIYDMLKAVDRAMRIDGICLLEKSGGVSGDYARGSVRGG